MILLRPTFSALVLLFLWAAQLACAQQIPPSQPDAKSFKLGAFEITSLHDSGMALPNDGSTIGQNASPAAVANVLAEAGVPTDKIPLDVDALLVRTPKYLVLIDTGLGPSGRGVLVKSLALVGVKPADITEILITHAHPDHVGGLLDSTGRPAFPNATIRMSAAEWSFMQSEADTSAEAATLTSQVKTFEPGIQILPGITPIALPGHTPGHVGYEIESRGQHLLDFGDIAHSSIVSLAEPGWTIKWDSNKAQAIETRVNELTRLAATHEVIFAPHFPFPGVGQIVKRGSGFHFQPFEPTH